MKLTRTLRLESGSDFEIGIMRDLTNTSKFIAQIMVDRFTFNGDTVLGEKVLYEGAATGKVILSEIAANFSRLEVFYKYGITNSLVSINDPNENRAGLYLMIIHGNIKEPTDMLVLFAIPAGEEFILEEPNDETSVWRALPRKKVHWISCILSPTQMIKIVVT